MKMLSVQSPNIIQKLPVSNNISCLLEKANGKRFLFGIRAAMIELEKNEDNIRILTRDGKVIAEKVTINST